MSMPHGKTTAKSTKKMFEDFLSSSKNIEILAENSLGRIRKGDEDLRIREMTSEEVASLETYARVTKRIINVKRIMDVS